MLTAFSLTSECFTPVTTQSCYQNKTAPSQASQNTQLISLSVKICENLVPVPHNSFMCNWFGINFVKLILPTTYSSKFLALWLMVPITCLYSMEGVQISVLLYHQTAWVIFFSFKIHLPTVLYPVFHHQYQRSS